MIAAVSAGPWSIPRPRRPLAVRAGGARRVDAGTPLAYCHGRTFDMHETSARRAVSALGCLRITAIGRPLRVRCCRNLTPAGFDIETDAAVLLQMPMAFEFVDGESSVILCARCVSCFETGGPQPAYVSTWVFLAENAESEAAIDALTARVHGVAMAS